MGGGGCKHRNFFCFWGFGVGVFWVYVVMGKKRDELIEQVCTAQSKIFEKPEIALLHQETLDRSGWGCSLIAPFSIP